MSDDGFSELAARSSKLRNENLQLVEGLRSFEKTLAELVGGLGCGGNSEFVRLEEEIDSDGDLIGHVEGYLSFEGSELWVVYKEEPNPGWEGARWQFRQLDKICTEWQRLLSASAVLDSLVADLLKNLDRELKKTASVVSSLFQFITIEKAEIDTDLDGLFSLHSGLLDSWLKARKSVQTDPELCITLSCSHVETVLKRCLKALGASGYEKDTIEKLGSKVLKILKDQAAIDMATSQMLSGIATFFLGIGTIRNAKSASHGKDDGYVPPSPELAQTVNHLAGVASVFVIRQTALLLKR